MFFSPEYMDARRAALFDWLVLFSSFMLGFVFPSLGNLVQSRLFYNLMLLALLLYTVGALLKHLPLSCRISSAGNSFRPVSYALFLAIGHWIIIFILVVLAEPGFWNFFGIPMRSSAGSGNGWFLVTAGGMAGLVTWLVYRDKSRRSGRPKPGAVLLFRQELIADILLVAGVSLISFVFWEKGAMGMLSMTPARSVGDIWFLFVLLALLFLFVYLPLRYLFFVEGRERESNRRRLLLIFGFLLFKALFEMLNI